MAETQSDSETPVRKRANWRWDALAAIVASLIGLLALLVSAYTAHVQRQQVRAEVWPHLAVAYQDLERNLSVFNKGVGPAIVHSVRVSVDGTPQPDWQHALRALGVPTADFGRSTLSDSVLSPGETRPILVLADEAAYRRFRHAMNGHGLLHFCYCSTLEECWAFEDRHPPEKPVTRAVAQCPRPAAGEAFRD